MDYLDYLIFKRDAYIDRLYQTDAGREYLEKAWTLEQTKPDREKLRENFGKGE